MKVAAEEHLGANFAVAGVFYPSCWDSPPFAQNLKQAFDGFTGQGKLASAGSRIRSRFIIDNGGIMPAPGSEFFTRTRSLQKMVKEIIMNEICLGNLLFEKRRIHIFKIWHTQNCQRAII